MDRQVALGHAILIASMKSGGGGIKTESMSTTRAKRTLSNRGHSPIPPGVSYLCQRGKHKRCTRNNCTCDCGHPI